MGKTAMISEKAARADSACLARLLSRLSRPGSLAVVRATTRSPEGAIIIHLSCGSQSELAELAPAHLLAAGRLGLVEPLAMGVALSKAGRCWLKRQLSGGDPFQDQHRELSIRDERLPDGSSNTLTVNDGESPLAWLRTRKDKSGQPLLSSAQFTAGERLRADFWFARMEPRVTANWSAYATANGKRQPGLAHGGDIRDEQLAARQRVRRALAGVGPELSGILLDVCCELRGLEEVERFRGWPQRSGKLVLQLALSALARHYGLLNDSASPGKGEAGRGQKSPGAGKLTHWGTADYRPRIDGGD